MKNPLRLLFRGYENQKMEVAREISAHYSDQQMREKMQKLVKIGKGPGHSMYDNFARILEERQKK